MSERNNIAIQNLSYVREVDNKNLLSGELDNLFNLTLPVPSCQRGGEKGEYSYIRGGVMEIIAMTIIGLFPFTTHATCTPTPDCASIGYTETSCETISLKCPFDQTKLYCFPCDSKFQYSCSGDNIARGVGDSCRGKYVSCECSGGGIFKNGVCSYNCTIGMIYYSDKSCSAEYDISKTPIGIVVKDNSLIVSQPKHSIRWGWGSLVGINRIDEPIAKQDYNGKSNMLALLQNNTSNASSNDRAIGYCYNYEPIGAENFKNQWYLPAMGELYDYIYSNYNIIKTSMTLLSWDFSASFYFSSSEYSLSDIWYLDFQNGDMAYGNKSTFYARAVCLLSIN